ncbi:MAG: phosphoenolpyruvate--protein phosphotransferase [Planctomycetes bacterium]|nr:phosphoenolpyruvate--protein phosphotransferase [Planctomycetota bacterium]
MSATPTTVHRGTTVVPGVALGPVHLLGYEKRASHPTRIAADEVESELNSLRRAVQTAREQIAGLRVRHSDTLRESELRIFDVHVALLDDPMFLSTLEKLIVEERFSVRAAIAKVLADYERIFELVEDQHLRERAGDLRDVAERVLRNLGDDAVPDAEPDPRASLPASGQYVIAARRLTVNDLFRIDDERVEGIVAEEGGISSHAAILARSMGIPTITGILDLDAKLRDGDFVVLDAGAGELHVEPDERLRAEYEAALDRQASAPQRAPALDAPHQMRDDTDLRVLAACGHLSEVELSVSFGMDGIGLYRTELLFLVESRKPSEDVLVHHYAQVLGAVGDGPGWLRLLDVASNAKLPWLHGPQPERNPALGMRGIRSSLREGDALRLQLRAILRAAVGHPGAGLLVPFVTSVTDLQRVRAAVVEERHDLRKRGIPCAESLQFAPIIEVPAAAFSSRALLREADFAVVAIDDLQSLMLAADRDNRDVAEYYSMHHPATLELLQRLAQDAEAEEKRMVLFGELAASPELIPFLIGVGFRDFAVAPAHAATVLQTVRQLTVDECHRIAEAVLQAPRSLDVQRILLTSVPRRGSGAGRRRR